MGGVWGHTHGLVRLWGEAAVAAAGRCPCRCCSERRTRAAAAPPGRERGSASTSAGEEARPEGTGRDGTGRGDKDKAGISHCHIPEMGTRRGETGPKHLTAPRRNGKAARQGRDRDIYSERD